MTAPKPHYLLFCDGNGSANGESAGSQRGRWRFVLEDLVSGERIEATDQEVACAPDRSALISVLRGLEALEQPSRVTLVTTSRYVSRGLQYGLTEWRDNDYSWEHFGAVQPIRNADIWKRIDRALAYHQVQCRWMAQEGTTETQDEPVASKKASHPAEKSAAEHATKHAVESTVSLSNVACVAPAKKSDAPNHTVQTTHRRSRSTNESRTKLSTSKYQRVYVDTSIAKEVSLETQNNLSVPSEKLLSNRRTPLLKNCFATMRIPVQSICRGPVWLCHHVWDVIIALDEWLESYLRCLFLLEPSKRQGR